MKTISFYLSAGLLVGLLSFHTQVVNLFKTEKPVTKNISLAIFTTNDYSSKEYDNSLACIKATVIKIKGQTQTTVWEKSFEELTLKEYPRKINALRESVSIPNILESKEKLAVVYTITYNTKGSILQTTYGEFISNDNAGKIFIKI